MRMAYFKSKLQIFFSGVGSIISFTPPNVPTPSAPKRYNPAHSVDEAFSQDWAKLGEDMRKAIKAVMIDGR